MRPKFVIGCILVFAVAFGFYCSALHLNFLYKDDYTIIKTSYLSPAKYMLGNFGGASGVGGFYRPTLILSVLLDRTVWGLNPLGFHLSNVLYHSVNCVLVCAAAEIITADTAIAVASGLLFAVLPVNAEAVNYISDRCDLLATMFILAAFILYLYFRRGYRVRYLILSMVLFVFALGGKESAACFPFLLLTYDWLDGRLMRNIRYFFCCIGVLAAYLIFRFIALGTFVGGYRISAAKALASVVIGPLKIFQLIFLPFIQDNFFIYFVLFPLIAVLCLCFLFWYSVRFRPKLLFNFAMTWVVIGILAVIYLLPVGFDFRGSRFWYLPSVGVAWLLSYIAFAQRRRWAAVLFAAFLVYSASFLLLINRDWTAASDMTLHIRSEAVSVVASLPHRARVYFWSIPDNYKGCYVGMPSLDAPFFATDRKVFGYQAWLTDIREVAGPQAKSAFHYMYDMDTGRFVRISYGYALSHSLSALKDPQTNRDKFVLFLRSLKRRD